MSTDAAILETASQSDEKFGRRAILMVVVLTIASFMEVLDTSIANVSIPQIAGNLSATTSEASWIVSSYLIANAVVVPISGWLSNFFGRKNVYMYCVALFVFASLLCGLSFNIEMLIISRILQGLAGGCLVPLEQAFIADVVPPEHRGTAFSIYGLTLMVAPILGGPVGGWITDNYSWHWIFFINIPIGIVSLFFIWNFVSETESTSREREQILADDFKIDLTGIFLFVVGIAALTVVLDKGNEENWFESNFIIIFSAIAFTALLTGVTWEWYQKNPAVDVRLFLNGRIAVATLMVGSIACITYGSLVLMPLMAQTVFGYSATDAGMILSPGAMVAAALMLPVGWLVKKVEARFLLIFGLSVTALALWNMTNLSLQADYATLARARIFQSFAAAFLFVPVTTAAFRSVPANKVDNASALISLAVNLGGSFGIALLGAFLTRQTHRHITLLSVNLSDYNQNYLLKLSELSDVLQQRGLSALDAAAAARGVIWQELQKQAGMLAFLDSFHLLMIIAICLIPPVFLFKSGKK